MNEKSDLPAAELRRAYNQVRAAAWGLLASPVLYALAAELVRRLLVPFGGLAALPDAVMNTLRYFFWGLAVLNLFFIRWLKNLVLERRIGVQEGYLPRQRFSPPVQRVLSAHVTALELAALPALEGLVLFLVAGRPLDLYPLLLATVVLLAFYFPRYGEWERELRHLLGPDHGGQDG